LAIPQQDARSYFHEIRRVTQAMTLKSAAMIASHPAQVRRLLGATVTLQAGLLFQFGNMASARMNHTAN